MKIEKMFLVLFVSILFVAGVLAATPNPTTGVGHDPTEIAQGTFGWLSNSIYTFPWNLNVNNLLTSERITANNLTLNGNITLGGISRGTWPSEVPPGFCVFSDSQSSCPSGWTRATLMDGRTIRGSSSSIGGTGGSNDHSHGLDGKIGKGDGGVTFAHTATTYSNSSWPPYMNVVICCKDGSSVEGTPSLPSLDCTDFTSSSTYESADISCNSAYPFALRGGCNSNCAWLSRNEIVGSTQYCEVITNIGDFCVFDGQKNVRARITCCKN